MQTDRLRAVFLFEISRVTERRVFMRVALALWRAIKRTRKDLGRGPNGPEHFLVACFVRGEVMNKTKRENYYEAKRALYQSSN